RFAIAGILAFNEEFNSHSRLNIPEVLASLKDRQITKTVEGFVDSFQSIRCHEDINVFSEAAVAVKEQGHASGDRVGDAHPLQASGGSFEGLVNGTFFLEVHTSLPENPRQVATES